MTVHTLQVANNASDSEFYSDATLVCDPVIYIYIWFPDVGYEEMVQS